MKTFRGGVCPEDFKEFTIDKKIRPVPAPPLIILPLRQHTGEVNEPLVKGGDNVKLGQRLGEARAFISAPVHSPVSGKVKETENFFNPIYGKGPSIIIENDGKDESIPFIKRENPETLSKEELREIIKNAGITGLGGASFPTHIKLNVPNGKHIDTLIINGAECEPYLTCDHRLMVEKTDEILKGIRIVAKILGVKNIFLAIEENKLSAAFAMEKAIPVVLLKTKYPQGGEKQLLKTILKREVPPGKLPFDVGAVVHNVATCFAIYQAVYEGRPLVERCVTFTGSCLKEPGNLLVRLGTLIKDVVEFCGGFTRDPAKIIVGGPMMGIAQYRLDMPIIKGVTGVVFLSRKDLEIFEESTCIRCAKCVDICPVNLLPTEIMRMVKYSRWQHLGGLHSSDCIECGACAYGCPSRIPLVQYIKLAKMKGLKG